jgi:hypothetical protein
LSEGTEQQASTDPSRDPCSDPSISSEPEQSEPQLAGADDFLPVFIWVVLHSHIPQLCSTCAFIETFLNPARMISKAGYCLINLRSAINFIAYLDPSVIKMDPDYFAEQLAIREEELRNLEQTPSSF